MTRRSYAGGAATTTITGSVASSGGVTIGIASTTGWPDGSGGKWAIVVDPGTASEEKMLVTSRSGSNLTVASGDRGYDGTSATAHSSGATIYITLTATDLDEANSHINATSAAHAATAVSFSATGGISSTTVQAAIAELDSEKAATSHTQASSTITDFTEAVQDVVGAMTVGGTALTATYSDAGGTVTLDVDNSGITATQLASDAVTTAKILDGNVTYAKLEVPVFALVSRSSTSVTTATLTDIVWDSETDASSMHSSGTFTIPSGKGGFYQCQVQVSFASGTTGIQLIAVINGTSYKLRSTFDYSGNAEVGSIILPLAATNTVKFQVYHTTGSSKTYTANGQVVQLARYA